MDYASYHSIIEVKKNTHTHEKTNFGCIIHEINFVYINILLAEFFYATL